MGIAKSKACNKCGEEKALNEYHKDSRNKSGLVGICRKCSNEAGRIKDKEWRKNQTPLERQIRNMSCGILNRAKGRTSKRQYYDRGIRCKIGETQAEVRAYLREHFSTEIQSILDNGDRPSIDRIDSKKSYEHGNLQIATFMDNSIRGGETSQKLFSQAMIIEDLETGDITRMPSIKATERAIRCCRKTIKNHINHNKPELIQGRYKLTREELS